MKSKILIFLFFTAPTMIVADPGPKRIGFIVGVSEYKNLTLGDLKTAKNDALGMTKILFSYGSYNRIQTLVQEGSANSTPTKYNILTNFEALLEETNPDDLLVFYFSGHGVVDYNDRVYLLPEDANPLTPFESGIAVEQLLEMTRKFNLKRVVFFIDACRNPDDGKGEEGRKFLVNTSFRDSEIVSVFYSTKVGYSSFEDPKSGYGIFTKYLIYGLEGRADSNFNGEVSYSELSNYVITSLKEWSKTNQKLQKPYTKEYAEKSEDTILTYAVNPETSLTDAPLFNPYNPTYAFRSFLFPGWGQYARGQEDKGKIYMSIFTLGVLYAGLQYKTYMQDKSNYESAIGIPPNPRVTETVALNYYLIEPYRQKMESSRAHLSQALTVLLVLWSANVFDFYLLGPNPKEKSGVLLEFDWENQGGMGIDRVGKLGYAMRF
ncbi:caspase family protein [Leptospira bandrabouensis]|uniref:caspase family protein n=1 Tax=Leptospira bandrabouensis TaxID=2484903 RepID=UPI00223CBB40|nr:caspase family protein [Leptospira bandrabouensis]MCW7458127.1 caspase family protein [Leptospira bandrabouensis]MCW7479000.1 caspase family protein [Leptospira bandrabouensis]MCW7486872.1 caspase family protein [Leptospira bandrabouensis]